MTWVLYFYKNNNDFSKRITIILSSLRFLSLTLLSFLLLSPMIKTIKRSVVKPSIIIAVDNSSSMVLNKDSAYYRNEFIDYLEELKSDLEKDYDVNTYQFGDRVDIRDGFGENDKPLFNEQMTDISALFRDINTRYYNRNVGALILASDGIYNTGSDPLYEMRNSKFPVYTILAGDTVSRKDIRIQKIAHNRTAFKGNRFPIEISLHAIESSGESSVVKIQKDDNTVLFTQSISVSSSNQVITIPALLDANETGIMKLRVTVDVIDGEFNKDNNQRDIFIEVRESKLKVAIVSDLPHPDIAALQRVIEGSNNFETDIFIGNEFNSQKPELFNLIILNQLPSRRNPFTQNLKDIIDSKTPLLFIIGSESNIQLINSLNIGLTLANFKGSFNEALPVYNPSFSLFIVNEQQRQFLQTVPPLNAPFANYNVANSVKILSYQQVGSTKTDMPLILFNEVNDNRIGVIVGEGMWKWRIYDYIRNQSHTIFDDLLSKTFQYLTAQTDKSRFRIDWKNFYAENENIEFRAMLFNETYQPITQPVVTFEITDERKRKFDFEFSSNEESYLLKVGTFEPGVYTFVAKADVPGESMIKTGSFVVTRIDLENTSLTANHRMLISIATESGGQYYYPQAFQNIGDDLRSSEEIKSISYTRKNFKGLIDYYPLMILLFLLLGTEWFLRKYMGSY